MCVVNANLVIVLSAVLVEMGYVMEYRKIYAIVQKIVHNTITFIVISKIFVCNIDNIDIPYNKVT